MNILDGIDVVVQYIILYAPAVLSVLGSVVTVATAVKKLRNIKDNNADTNRKIIEQNKNLLVKLNMVENENYELKKALDITLKDAHHIYVKEDTNNGSVNIHKGK